MGFFVIGSPSDNFISLDGFLSGRSSLKGTFPLESI